LAQGDPYGYVINRGPVETKTAVYGVWQDLADKACRLVLCRWMDGSAIFFRYPVADIRIGDEAVEWLRRFSPASLRRA
jgi:hypothetical protein